MSLKSLVQYDIAHVEPSSATTTDRFEEQVIRQQHYFSEPAEHSIQFVGSLGQFAVGHVTTAPIPEKLGQWPEFGREVADEQVTETTFQAYGSLEVDSWGIALPFGSVSHYYTTFPEREVSFAHAWTIVTRLTKWFGYILKQGFEELYNQRLKEGNIVRKRLSRLKLSRLRSHRQKLHGLKPYRLRPLGWGSPGWSSIGSQGLPVLKIFKLQQCTFKLQQWGLGLKISNFQITTMVWGWGGGWGSDRNYILLSLSRKKKNIFTCAHDTFKISMILILCTFITMVLLLKKIFVI